MHARSGDLNGRLELFSFAAAVTHRAVPRPVHLQAFDTVIRRVKNDVVLDLQDTEVRLGPKIRVMREESLAKVK